MLTDSFEQPNSSIYSKEYEDYLIKGDSSCLQNLLPGTLEHEYIQLITELRKPTPYTDKLDNQIQQFVSKASKYNQTIPLKYVNLSVLNETITGSKEFLYAKYAGFGLRLQSIIVFIQPAGHASINKCIAFETILEFLLNASVIIEVANA